MLDWGKKGNDQTPQRDWKDSYSEPILCAPVEGGDRVRSCRRVTVHDGLYNEGSLLWEVVLQVGNES